jgi:uncharacterized protein
MNSSTSTKSPRTRKTLPAPSLAATPTTKATPQGKPNTALPNTPIAGVLLYPGAGTDAQHPALIALEEALRAEFVNLAITRVDFPYRQEGRKMPDRAPKLVAAVHNQVSAFAQSLGVSTAALVIGGRSMGGRMCSMAVAEGLRVAGLLCVSYPLHPPKKPETLRIEHLPKVCIPSLFISGSRDDFGTPEELRTHIDAIPGPAELVILQGKGHDLNKADTTIAMHTIKWLRELETFPAASR